jgi:MerR family transcriptional regulator, thiopeptide resistance regulator
VKVEPTLSIGEVSRRTRLSERALRLYEAEGLVSPARSEAGRRVYSLADLRRLQQVQILRRAGYALAEIRDLLKRRDFDAGEVISLHLGALKEERAALDRSIALLEGAQARLAEGAAPDAAALCELIRLAERGLEEENWRKALSRYWTDEEQERWKTALASCFPGDCRDNAGETWRELVGRVEAAMARGVRPDSDAALALGRDWLALQQPLVNALPDYWPRLAQMYAEMDQWSHLAAPPFSKAVLDYVKAAVAAGRAKGAIPPSRYAIDAQGNPIFPEKAK